VREIFLIIVVAVVVFSFLLLSSPLGLHTFKMNNILSPWNDTEVAGCDAKSMTMEELMRPLNTRPQPLFRTRDEELAWFGELVRDQNCPLCFDRYSMFIHGLRCGMNLHIPLKGTPCSRCKHVIMCLCSQCEAEIKLMYPLE
jgi:hypothetical protein